MRYCLDIFSLLLYNIIVACVAQLVVQLIRNEQVAGSSPVTSSIFITQNKRILNCEDALIFMLFKIIPHGLKIKKSVSAKNKFGHALLFN